MRYKPYRTVWILLLTLTAAALLMLTACPTEPPGAGEAAILSFVFAAADNDALGNDITGTIEGAKISATVPFGTDVTALVPTVTIAEGASVVPASGEAQDFSDPVTYTVTAADGETAAEYTVTVSVAPEDASTECDITGFLFAAADNGELSSDVTGTINGTDISAEVPRAVDVTALIPVITISAAASVEPSSGTTQDFSSPVTYTVTAEDETTTREYSASVTVPGFSTTAFQQIHSLDFASGDYFGGAPSLSNHCVDVSADGSTIVVGAPEKGPASGAAYVFEYEENSEEWTQSAKLTVVPNNDDRFGFSVSITNDGSLVAVGAVNDEVTHSDSGLVFLFERPSGGWTSTSAPTAMLNTSRGSAKTAFGYSVEICRGGELVIAGDIAADVSFYAQAGQVYVFRRPGNGWADFPSDGTETTRLSMSDSVSHDDAFLGCSVAASDDGSTVAAGAEYFNDSGAVFIFHEPENGWDSETEVSESAILTTSATELGERLGYSIAMSSEAETIVAGAYDSSVTTDLTGAVYVYHRSDTWQNATEDQLINPPAGQWGGRFGYSVDLSAIGNYLLVGYPQYDLSGAQQGTAYVYRRDPVLGEYADAAAQVFEEPGTDFSWLGNSVAITADAGTILLGAPGWNTGGMAEAGAVFVYR